MAADNVNQSKAAEIVPARLSYQEFFREARRRALEFGVEVADRRVRFLEPLGLSDVVASGAPGLLHALRQRHRAGGVLPLPRATVTLRDVTERSSPPPWTPPPEYLAPDVSSAVVKIVLGYLWKR